jgi:hypothetical protein
MRVMAWARSHGHPVPQVYERTETDLILDRLDGPTMLADLARRPWRLVRHARTLAGLHRQLHAIPRRLSSRRRWARVAVWCTWICIRATSSSRR